MYRIQAYNYVKKYFIVEHCSSSERQSFVQGLIDSGEYTHGGITYEWLARCD